ncbi:hypothetical protein AB0K60_24215 [Thermopolyspora sp. NPDC052614]|uniref:hypothetical protein n=1 Tax=Thermopolyspora sp. NPDC052614 TaxID=3155682 RepID=UPI0034483363
MTDNRGNVIEVWLSDGLPVQPPPSGTRCPKCRATSITAFPKGYLDRHPDITYRDKVDLGVSPPESARAGSASPAAEAHGVPAPDAAWRPRRRLAISRAVYLTAIAVAALLVTVYEIYETVLTKARPH